MEILWKFLDDEIGKSILMTKNKQETLCENININCLIVSKDSQRVFYLIVYKTCTVNKITRSSSLSHVE